MAVRTDTERVRHSRKMVLEFLGSSVDLSTAPDAQRYCERMVPILTATETSAPPSRSR